MPKQNFDYDKIYTAGWKDAIEEMQEKFLAKESEIPEEVRTKALILLGELRRINRV